QILHACLDLVAMEDTSTAMAARDVICIMLLPARASSTPAWTKLPLDTIWRTVQSLVTSDIRTQRSLIGYSLWLRLMLLPEGTHITTLEAADYWKPVMHGLRRGDSERRKICLNIFKLTLVTDSVAVSDQVRAQYDRFCTVFETVVLARYINQVVECQADLDALAANKSLRVEWLYVLLASGLDKQMQDSNRKFIGNWVMHANLDPNDDSFLQFFRDDFLPWAIQGSLFVSTLRMLEGRRRCLHGDRMVECLRRQLANANEPVRLADVVIDTILLKRNSLFAYATVYLIEGLGDTLSVQQRERLSGISGLPEVARDYLFVKIHNQPGLGPTAKSSSRRELREKEAIEKCSKFDIESSNMEDMWDDLEYLEYPKDLLVAMVSVVLHPQVLLRATKDATLAAAMRQKVHALLRIAGTKIFMFAPLVVGVRRALITEPAAAAVLDIAELVISVAERPPQPTPDLMLEEAIIPLTPFAWEHYFGERPSYGFAAFVDLVNRLHSCPGAAGEILARILRRWRAQKVPPPTVSPWKNALQLQVLLLCLEQFTPDESTLVLDVLEALYHVLEIEPLPQYRYLLEWMTVRLLVRFQLEYTVLERLATRDHHSNPKHLASLMKIGTILACSGESNEDFGLQLATSFVPLAASSKVVIRHEAQWQVPILLEHARAHAWTSIIENAVITTLNEYIQALDRFIEPPLERQFGRFNPQKDHTLTNLVEGNWLLLDPVDTPLTTREEFVKLYSNVSRDITLPGPSMSLGDPVKRPVPAKLNGTPRSVEHAAIVPRTSGEVSAALQTKGTAYLARSLSDPTLLGSRPDHLIVVGSLVDNPYNLGGLSRVSEVFGASALCLQNQNVVSNKDFTSVSVSSHLHFPIVQLSASGIPAYLADRKMEGFTIVGIEQTNRSVILGSQGARLPEKIVLVVGGEREGIPAVVLMECDMLVEIPQQGITRSLNVQTAVAIVLYEYARQ
ncbi:hypothetical protein BDY17DRAFT_239671, partial [Neohortaea acidophila]